MDWQNYLWTKVEQFHFLKNHQRRSGNGDSVLSCWFGICVWLQPLQSSDPISPPCGSSIVAGVMVLLEGIEKPPVIIPG